MNPRRLTEPLAAAGMRALRLIRRPPPWLLLALVVVAIEVAYVFIISAGSFTKWPTWNGNYNLQAEGFRAGHLYLTIPPSPELLAQANPYDWSNSRLWFWDASLYKRHYYFYWGPFPSLVLAAYKAVFGIKEEIGDQYPLFAGYTILLVTGALFIDRMARRLFPRVPLPLVLLAIAVFGFANPTPYMIATPGIYEAAIVLAQAFLMLGLVLVFDAIWKAPERPGGAPSAWLLALAGLSWGIAIACRASVGPAALVFWLATIFAVAPRRPRRWLHLLRDSVWLAGPVALCSAGLLAFNKARFESWFEFGVSYQLNTLPFIQSKSFVPLNLWSYLMRPMASLCRFPFMEALRNIGQRGFPAALRLPPGYSTGEPLAGLLLTAPWTWLSAVAWPMVGLRLRRWWRHERAAGMPYPGRISLWTIICAAAFGSLPLLFMVAGNTTTMRYLSDISTGILLLSIWAVFALYELAAPRRWARWSLVTALVGVGALTIVLGMLLGFQGYDEMFKNHNPQLYYKLQVGLSFCR